MGTQHFPYGVPPSGCMIFKIVGRHITSSELSENRHSLEETLWVTIFLYVVWYDTGISHVIMWMSPKVAGRENVSVPEVSTYEMDCKQAVAIPIYDKTSNCVWADYPRNGGITMRKGHYDTVLHIVLLFSKKSRKTINKQKPHEMEVLACSFLQ